MGDSESSGFELSLLTQSVRYSESCGFGLLRLLLDWEYGGLDQLGVSGSLRSWDSRAVVVLRLGTGARGQARLISNNPKLVRLGTMTLMRILRTFKRTEALFASTFAILSASSFVTLYVHESSFYSALAFVFAIMAAQQRVRTSETVGHILSALQLQSAFWALWKLFSVGLILQSSKHHRMQGWNVSGHALPVALF